MIRTLYIKILVNSVIHDNCICIYIENKNIYFIAVYPDFAINNSSGIVLNFFVPFGFITKIFKEMWIAYLPPNFNIYEIRFLCLTINTKSQIEIYLSNCCYLISLSILFAIANILLAHFDLLTSRWIDVLWALEHIFHVPPYLTGYSYLQYLTGLL